MAVKDKLSEFAETTSMHGVAYINSSTKFLLKIFWSTVVIGSLVICIVYIYSSLTHFLTFSVLVQTKIKFEKLPFPAVTICNLNPIRLSQLDSVPKLKQMTGVCSVQPDQKANTTSIDFCANYRHKLALATRRNRNG